jgi:hypothetical protein
MQFPFHSSYDAIWQPPASGRLLLQCVIVFVFVYRPAICPYVQRRDRRHRQRQRTSHCVTVSSSRLTTSVGPYACRRARGAHGAQDRVHSPGVTRKSTRGRATEQADMDPSFCAITRMTDRTCRTSSPSLLRTTPRAFSSCRDLPTLARTSSDRGREAVPATGPQGAAAECHSAICRPAPGLYAAGLSGRTRLGAARPCRAA